MKKHLFNSLTDFYAAIVNKVNAPDYQRLEVYDDPEWKGLSLYEIKKSKFSYPLGIQELAKFKDIEVEKAMNVKFWNQFDGFDIDVDRMYENMDFLLDTRKVKKLPKAIDIYVNIGEHCGIEYKDMMCKTYVAVKIIDRLESLGVRCAVYACSSSYIKFHSGEYSKKANYVEVCIKNHNEALNIGAICTAISPWMFRQWILLYIMGNCNGVSINGISRTAPLPTDLKGIIINTGSCLTTHSANNFIQSVKVA
ncbi:MAG TPA: hypothetical protein DCL77_14655 [Prolixibacteraceae bacterium]|jgi:hypothetical protein|nr:hypothetical protein [Prolixibacteraceae bacterium]